MNAVQPVRAASASAHGGHRPAVTSISLRIASLLATPMLNARVESAFAEACNLVAETGQRFSLVDEGIGNGPLHAVLSTATPLDLLDVGDFVAGDGRWLHMGRAGRVDLRPARAWTPSPNYARLAEQPHVALASIARLRAWLPAAARSGSLAAAPMLPAQDAPGIGPAAATAQTRARRLIHGLLDAYRRRRPEEIYGYAHQLAGLGPGLTPAGDDWLCGWLVGLRSLAALTPDNPPGQRLPLAEVCQGVVAAANGRTTGLSLAFLQAAADGAAAQPWHDLLDALVNPDPDSAYHATRRIMRHGATSGADMLAGFIAAWC